MTPKGCSTLALTIAMMRECAALRVAAILSNRADPRAPEGGPQPRVEIGVIGPVATRTLEVIRQTRPSIPSSSWFMPAARSFEVPDVSTLSRPQKTRAMTVPQRGGASAAPAERKHGDQGQGCGRVA